MTDLGATLAADAAQELVKAIVAGLVEVTKKLPALWRHSGRDRQAMIGAELERSAAEVTAARKANREGVQAWHEGAWEGRFRDLLAEHPETADELREIVAQLRRSGLAEINARLRLDHIQADRDMYVAGRDQKIIHRHGGDTAGS